MSRAHPSGPEHHETRLRVFAPVAHWVARLETSVRNKLFGGLLVISILLLALGAMSITVLNRVNGQVDRLSALQTQTDRAQQMMYKVTAQSHYRAMAIVDPGDTSWTPKIALAKDDFDALLADAHRDAIPQRDELFTTLRADNETFRAASAAVTELFDAGELDQALALHIADEHEVSHVLEAQLRVLIGDSEKLLADQTAAFESDRQLLTIVVALFSFAGLGGVVVLGSILSSSLVTPVRRVDHALGLIADGDFDLRVEVPNRDEFGTLVTNLNRTTHQLATVYADLEQLNAGLRATVGAQGLELDRASQLKRYLPPQVAEQILAGEVEVSLGSSRKYLTTFFSDIRGFTELSERMEPEELVAELNDYLTEMTDLVFEHGGTLDKYIGDAVMVFFNDPIPQQDHATRAVKMAIAMQHRMAELAQRWSSQYEEVFSIGIGITTGWVTVGNIGSPTRTDYTVLGNQVNLASRLADRAGAGEILLTERTLVEADVVLESTLIDEVELKGVNRPLKIYRVDP